MNLNHIFLFLAVISPLLVLARAWRPGSIYRGWRIAAFVVLVITGAAWISFRSAAGYIAGGAWFAFLFLPAIGLRKVTELAARQHYRSARKLAAVLQVLHPSAELREQIQLFRHLESHQNDRAGVASFPIQHEIAGKDRHRHFRNAPAVFILILLNATAFIFEISFGNWTDPEVLHQLGALEPYAVVVQGQYWRLFTALLYVLGPPLERSIGALRFAICYLISGLISSAGVVALTVIGIVQVAQLVGASGCIMGIVGAWAGFLLRHRHAPHAKQRLGNVLMIVAIQTAFDLSTPQVSMAAHLCGLFSGAVLGFVLAPRTVK